MTVVAVAYKAGALVLSAPRPARHKDIWGVKLRGTLGFGQTQRKVVTGFLTTDGRFLDRQQAARHVVACGQPLTCLTINPQLGLFSEDLW